MKKVLLWLWQLPQNILGLLVILVTGARFSEYFWWAKWSKCFGVSLGEYIIFGHTPVSHDSLKHEQGHQKQSLYLGPLYLLLIGLPSLLGNIVSRIEWVFSSKDKKVAEHIIKWYYKQPWEAWADKLGGVER